MTDRYASFATAAPGRALVKRLGLPDPPRLRRYRPGDPLVHGPVLLGAAPGGRLRDHLGKLLAGAGVQLRDRPDDPADPAIDRAPLHAALVYDATGIAESSGLRAVYDFFHPLARAVSPSGRVVVFGTLPEACPSPREATAQRAIEGFTRSLGKELGRGITVQLVHVAPDEGAQATPGWLAGVESTLRFLLSGKSAYVAGQVIRIGSGRAVVPADWEQPLDGEVALVT